MNFVGIMYSAHLQQTSSVNPPFSYSLPFNHQLINKDKYKSLRTEDKLDEFVQRCMSKYKERHSSQPIGSVDYNPKTWTKFALKSIATTYKTKEETIVFPNGCCSREEHCPINLFYEIVLEELCLE